MANDANKPADLTLCGKVVLVTGAARGIGAAIADRFERLEAHVVRNDLPDDVSLAETADRTVARILDRFARLDILVNNAGINAPGGILEIEDKVWTRVLAVNLNGTFFFARAAYRAMLPRGWGRIINLSSLVVDRGPFFTLAFTKQLAAEAAPHGITVNAIAPGIIETAIRPPLDEQQRRKIEEWIPARRMGTADEVAGVTAFLASDSGSYITGEVIRVTGGF
jgi:NAD(P)-dependent dehydrogenase (short-subunit alcohol dehydrogenase family)